MAKLLPAKLVRDLWKMGLRTWKVLWETWKSTWQWKLCWISERKKISHTNGNAEKDGKIFLLKFVRREKKMAKIYSLSKRWQKFTKFLVFLGFLGLYRLFRGVGIGWAVFGSKRSTGCRDMRG